MRLMKIPKSWIGIMAFTMLVPNATAVVRLVTSIAPAAREYVQEMRLATPRSPSSTPRGSSTYARAHAHAHRAHAPGGRGGDVTHAKPVCMHTRLASGHCKR